MQFRLLPTDKNVGNIIDFIRHHYHRPFEELHYMIMPPISKALFDKIKEGEGKDELLQLTEEFYEENQGRDELQQRLESIKQLWQRFEKRILAAIKNITGLTINTEEITCYVDSFTNLGFYGHNDITVSLNHPEEDMLMIITHELFHIFYWKKVKELGLKMEDEGREWALSEVAAYLLTKHPLLRVLWPKAIIRLYPEIKKVHEEVKDFWGKQPFNEFLTKSYIFSAS